MIFLIIGLELLPTTSTTPTTKVYMKDVKSSYNSYTGMELNLAEDSECAMNMVEASYNGAHGFEIRLYEGSESTMSNAKASYNAWTGVRYYAFSLLSLRILQKSSSRVPTFSLKIKKVRKVLVSTSMVMER